MKTLALAPFALALGACANLSPTAPAAQPAAPAAASAPSAAKYVDPEAPVRAADALVRRGNCEGALATLRAAAQRGEPWAQLRLGWFAQTQQCPGVAAAEGEQWLTRAACYTARNAWEQGDRSASGAEGFFNARYAAVEAAYALMKALTASSASEAEMQIQQWYWNHIAVQHFEPEHPTGKGFAERLAQIEQNMSAESLARAKALDLCTPLRQAKPQA